MHFSKRHDLAAEILQAAALALLVGFIYHYFGPSSTTTASLQAFGALGVCGILLVATLNHGVRIRTRPLAGAPPLAEKPTEEEMRRWTELLQRADRLQLEKAFTGLYGKRGCAAQRHSSAESEDNFSLIIDRAGQKTVVLCKPWKDAELTTPDIIELSTGLRQAGLSRGVLITLRECAPLALSVARSLNIDIVNRDALANLFAACSEDSRSKLLRDLGDERKFCPSCHREMVLRTATKGLGAGEQFWGCTAFPECLCTEPK